MVEKSHAYHDYTNNGNALLTMFDLFRQVAVPIAERYQTPHSHLQSRDPSRITACVSARL
jgi:hypothetical protein